MTDEELAEIKARVEAATPGPWESGLQTVYKDLKRSLPEGWVAVYQVATHENTPWLALIDSKGGWLSALISPRTRSFDAEFIAHARQDIPALLAEVERLQAERNGHAITLATQRKVAELEAENERLQGVLRMVDDWIAATLPGSSSEAIRALIAEALEGAK